MEDEEQIATLRKIQEATKRMANPEVAVVTHEVVSPQKVATQELPNWYVFKDSVKYGPLNQSALTDWLREGKITIFDFVWTPSFGTSWKRIIGA